MSSRLPEFVDPWRLVDLGKCFSGRVAVTDLPRLVEAVREPRGFVELELAFGRDEQKRPYVRGSVRTVLVLECQRCLSSMDFPVDARINLALVEGLGEAERLPESYDPLLIEEPRIRLLDIVEDELLLSLPQAPRHLREACVRQPRGLETDSGRQESAEERPNPFSELAKLKQNLDSN